MKNMIAKNIARVVPMRFEGTNMEEFDKVLGKLKEIYAEEMEVGETVMLGEEIQDDVDAVLIPVMWVDTYTNLELFKKTVHKPILVITTVFGVSLMFDWESVAYLKSKGFEVYNPHSIELGKTILKALALKRVMKGQKFLIFQDTPGDGLIPEQFKIFYWWNDECTNDIKNKFGIEIVRKPYKALCEYAKSIPDADAKKELERWDFDSEGVNDKAMYETIKMFMALREEVDKTGNVAACGVNCINEAYDTNVTPCLAWNLLYRDRGVMWGCEGDTSALLTQYIMGSVIDTAIFTTNIYPFLSGMPALSHEKIQSFPDVEDPDNHALLVHCGYLGCSIAQKYATKWSLKPSVLAWLFGEHSTAIDAEVEKGDITMCKLHSNFKSLMVEKAVLEEYVQYPGSDCRNGGLIKVADGYRLMEKIYSHHVIVLTGKRSNQMRAVCSVFGIDYDEI